MKMYIIVETGPDNEFRRNVGAYLTPEEAENQKKSREWLPQQTDSKFAIKEIDFNNTGVGQATVVFEFKPEFPGLGEFLIAPSFRKKLRLDWDHLNEASIGYWYKDVMGIPFGEFSTITVLSSYSEE